MRQTVRVPRDCGVLGFLASFLLCTLAATGEVRTNWVDRWITNTVEVYVPANRFVTEYHTNLILRTHTNVVNVFSTNLVTTYRTNHVQVDCLRTNFVQACRTNYKDLNLTNWTTVVVLKTNWIQRTFTNMAEVRMGQSERPVEPAAKAQAPTTEAEASLVPALTIQATRGPKQTPNQADVGLSVRWADQGQSSVRVVQWKVQSEDGSILCFGQDPQFRRSLPFGNYRVEVKARQGAKAEIMTARATVAVGAQALKVLDQRMLARR